LVRIKIKRLAEKQIALLKVKFIVTRETCLDYLLKFRKNFYENIQVFCIAGF